MTRRPFAAHAYPRRSTDDDPHDWSRQRPFDKLTRLGAGEQFTDDDILVRTTWVVFFGERSMEQAWSAVWKNDGRDRGRTYPYPLPVSAGGLEEAHNALVARVQAGELP